MLELHRTDDPEELFLGLDKRRERCACFYRITGFNDNIERFITRYHSAARAKGAVIGEKISNPDESQITYFADMAGQEFHLDKFFIGKTLGRWLPQMNNSQCTMAANAVYNALERFKAMGKNEAMVRNFYIRLMCWLYYKFSTVVIHFGENDAPKIIAGGKLGRHELLLLKLFHECGCDVVLLQNLGEEDYNSFDPRSELSKKLYLPDMQPFPQGFDLAKAEKAEEERRRRAQMYGGEPLLSAATNMWMAGKDIIEELKTPPASRGNNSSMYYNSFCKLSGVPDKLTYKNDLYRFYTEIKNSGRKYLIVENKIPTPANEELGSIDRTGFNTKEQLIAAMLRCVKMPPDEELKKLVAKAYIDVMLEESAKPDMTSQRLTTMTVCVSCWLNRYLPRLFSGWGMPMIPLFVMLGGCSTSHEAAFLKVMSRLPCDVLILVPNLNAKCVLEDARLFELKYPDSLNVTEYPTEMAGIQLGTAAYHAERELDQTLYNDGTGLFRDYQYAKANSVILKTMYEEIDMLWRQETKFRPNFSVFDDTVNIPVIFAKVSGVKDSQPSKYWKNVQNMLTENTLVIGSVPYLSPNDNNPMRYNSGALLRGGKLNREAVLARREYPYRYLRQETQNFIFDKIDLLINSRLINGTFQNGTEYLIASTLLFMPPAVLRLIQGFDFTKVNPKIIYINTGERPISLEDAILMAFLNMAGFDVLFLVPTGYRTVEGFFSKDILDEHKIGEYMYDLQAPRLKVPKAKPPAPKNKPLFGGLFRKGN